MSLVHPVMFFPVERNCFLETSNWQEKPKMYVKNHIRLKGVPISLKNQTSINTFCFKAYIPLIKM